MTKSTPYKICPKCGTYAGLEAQVCARCSHRYRTQFVAPQGQTQAPISAAQQQSVPVGRQNATSVPQNSMASRCSRCGQEIGFLAAVTTFKQTGRCAACQAEWNAALQRFRQAFYAAIQGTGIRGDGWANLQCLAQQARLPWGDALAAVRQESIQLLERQVAFAMADGEFSDQELTYFQGWQKALAVPDAQIQPLLERVRKLRQITTIRQGRLPRIDATALHLECDEICHLYMAATYHKATSRTVTPLNGDIVATNKKLRFLSANAGVEMDWRRIVAVSAQPNGFRLQLEIQKGNGFYAVPDPTFAAAVIETLVRMHKRNLIAPSDASGTPTRHIPQDVKMAVWQRDQGRCAECGSTSYLEFDHIIPFSKGGANTTNNIQLLCRDCNLKKGNRL
jgi:Restriction endonuclease